MSEPRSNFSAAFRRACASRTAAATASGGACFLSRVEPGGAHGSGIADFLEQVAARIGGKDPRFGLDRGHRRRPSRVELGAVAASGLVPNCGSALE